MMGDYESVDWLRANCSMIHYFGLGFIQVKLSDVERMHFYVSDLEPIVPEEDVHNHRYDFESTVLRGRLCQELYSFAPVNGGGTHVIEEVSCEEGASPQRLPLTYVISLASRHMYAEGSSYFVDHGQFHRVARVGATCVTLLRRSGYKKQFAHVIKPIGGGSVCPFSRKVPERELWESVAEALRE